MTHVRRHHGHHGQSSGHLYQGRYKHFCVSDDEHFLTVCRYVEANPLRAKLVRRAQNWRWCSLWRRTHGDEGSLLSAWPTEMPRDWVRVVNRPQSEAEEAALRRAVVRGTPFGSEPWTRRMAGQLGLGFTLRPRGRPGKDGTS